MLRRKKKELAPAMIRISLRKGIKSIEELCQITRFRPSTFRILCEEKHITLPEDIIPYRYRDEEDSLIDQGLPLRLIAELCNSNRQSVLNYIKDSGQHNSWLENKKRYYTINNNLISEKNNLNRRNNIEERKRKLAAKRKKDLEYAKGKGLPYLKATEYIYTKPTTSYSKRFLVNFFRRYYNAIVEGKKLSLEELGGKSLFPMSSLRILRTVGLKPMHETRERRITPLDKKEALMRGFYLRMSAIDISYFLDLDQWITNVHFRLFDEERKSTKGHLASFHGKRLNYRLASQIYENSDEGNGRKYTIRKLGINSYLYDYALEHRNKIEPEIVMALRVLYFDKTIDRPYV